MPYTTIITRRDVWAGAAYLALGLFTVFASSGYEMGTLRQMGPGFYPTALGIMLSLLGIASMARGIFVAGERAQAIALKPLIIIGLTPVVFGLLLDPLGLPIALFSAVMAGALASRHFRLQWLPTLALLGFVLGCTLVFVILLKVQMPILGWVWGG